MGAGSPLPRGWLRCRRHATHEGWRAVEGGGRPAADVAGAARRADPAGADDAPGTVISSVESNPLALQGRRLKGKVILHVPKQTTPIPKAVLDYAEGRLVTIRQAPE